MDSPKKRKIDLECRVFNKDWMSRYFFTQVGNNAVCLLCSQTVSVNKKYNVSRHYRLKHFDYGKNLSVEEWEARAGLPLGQEKSGKILKNDKSQKKMGGFEKKSGNLIKFKKGQVFSV